MDDSAHKRYKTGVSIGKFFPMHLGHMSGIHTLEYFCEKVYVIFYHNKSQEERIINEWGVPYTINLRIADAQEVFKDYDNIIIVKVDIPDDLLFPDNYLDIKALVENAIGGTIDLQTFGAEERSIYEPYKYARNVVLGTIHAVETRDNKIVPLHATLIRDDYDFYKNSLSSTTQRTIDSLKSSKLID